ncbi:MAG: alkaline phosphatase [Nocardioidaceae bacterium]|nr:alkaline phosphatase [Nocardioidaceae bacterium]NUS50025.1 alkaline phosphatase [Nocardioidaceae bacterium]
MTTFGRRTFLSTAASAVVVGAASRAVAAPYQTRSRIALPSGVQSGEVTTGSAVLWSRASAPGRLVARVTSGRAGRVLRGGLATPGTDHTAKLFLTGLAPGREYEALLWFEDEDGHAGETQRLRFGTASERPAAQSFVWTGDTCGQGWGINPDLGGMVGYRAMHRTRPDFLVHCGDTIYADGPIQAEVAEPGGAVWRNLVTEEVSHVAETLDDFRGRHRYNQLDDNVRAMYADVPVLAQWDDHETHNNWYPGQVLDDARYTERRVDVLAARARQAWQENMPIAAPPQRQQDDGFVPARIYRTVPRGRNLDVFCLDMRTFKDPNTPGTEPQRTHILGQEQTDWLIREVSRSRATWKVISADLPLGVVVPDGPVNQESLSNRDPGAPLGKELELAAVLSAFKRNGVRNVVWVTADVHYCAAHHYSPERASFTDFDPFWEIVAGPIAAGTFGPNQMDATFGPEVVFSKVADYPNQSPRGGNQFFGHADIAADGRLTLSLRNSAGTVLWTRTLDPT